MSDRMPRPATFESRVTTHDGIEVHMTILVPPSAFLPALGDCGEIAQSAVGRAVKTITKLQEEPPF